jgi:energy-coupling factor transporter ATP-binding protein EcfA2
MYTVEFSRELKNKPTRSILRKQVSQICERVIGQKMYRGFWQVKLYDHGMAPSDQGYYTVNYKVCFSRKGGHKRTEPKQWKEIYSKILSFASSGQFKSRPWQIESKDAPKDVKPIVEVIKDDHKNYGSIKLENGDYFSHIFDREAQILRVRQAIELAKMTSYQERQHCVLYGPPGCGKTEIVMAFGRMLGEENNAWMKFDATTTTQAGAINIILNSNYVPPILLVEEIEKTELNSLRWMLGLLDQRAEVRQTNFRVGNRAKNVKMLCIATVNDMDLFNKTMSGALASRFSNQIYCPHPSPETMKKILHREIAKINGNPKWADAALEMANQYNIVDARKIRNICLCGRDTLLDGSYQEAFKLTLPPK